MAAITLGRPDFELPFQQRLLIPHMWIMSLGLFKPSFSTIFLYTSLDLMCSHSYFNKSIVSITTPNIPVSIFMAINKYQSCFQSEQLKDLHINYF